MQTLYYGLPDEQAIAGHHKENLVKVIDEAVLEQPNPTTGERLKNLGLVYLSLGQKQEAKECFVHAYAIYKSCFGEQHTKTITVKENLDRSV